MLLPLPAERFQFFHEAHRAVHQDGQRQVATVGPNTRQWTEATTQARGVEAVRVLVGLKHLAGKHPSDDLEEACRVALTHGPIVCGKIPTQPTENFHFQLVQDTGGWRATISSVTSYSHASPMQV